MRTFKSKKYFDLDNVIRVHFGLERTWGLECTTDYGELEVHLGLGCKWGEGSLVIKVHLG